jgi:TonB family protein
LLFKVFFNYQKFNSTINLKCNKMINRVYKILNTVVRYLGQHLGLKIALIQSLFIHATLFCAFFFGLGLTLSAEYRGARTELLNLELLGMLSDRQEVGDQKIEEPEPEPTPQPPPLPTPPEPEKVDEVITPTPVPPPPAPVPRPKPKPKAEAGKKNKVAKRIDAPTSDDLKRQYLSQMGRLLNNKIVYPEEAKNHLLSGKPVIAFTVNTNGSLVPGSLRVARSSGHEILDRHAMATVRQAAPFPPPPQRMEMTVTMSFTKDLKNRT